ESGPEPAEAIGAAAPKGSSGKPTFDPILPAEVEAFKRALSAGPASAAEAAAMTHARPAAGAPAGSAQGASARGFDGSARHGPQSYTLLTGFEDTELPDARVTALSGSQYGDLN
ncbi:MAG: hypothetical protein ABI409_20370, partial [Ramlibacter sp.]